MHTAQVSAITNSGIYQQYMHISHSRSLTCTATKYAQKNYTDWI